MFIFRTIANYIVGNRIYGKTFYLPAVFTDIKLEYQKVSLPFLGIFHSEHHSGKSAIIRELNHGSGVCKENYV